MAIIENEFYEKNERKYFCKICDFKCSFMSDWSRHIGTRKHTKQAVLAINGNNGNHFNEKNETPKNICKFCAKDYNTCSGLWRHKKKCGKFASDNITKNSIHYCNDNDANIIQKDIHNKDEIILMIIKQNAELVKENSEFKNMMMKVLENGTHNTTNNTTNTNSHNKAFNLNFFLNETCKDAMNIMDFVESIQLQLSDLENVGKLGYVEGITNIITKNLQALDVTQRPIHCTDKKREVLYIKDADKWEKEDDDKKKIRKAIKRVASKNHRLILKFKEAHPDCLKASSHYSDQYNKIIIESCGGSGDNDLEKEDKIIRNISKTVIVDK